MIISPVIIFGKVGGFKIANLVILEYLTLNILRSYIIREGKLMRSNWIEVSNFSRFKTIRGTKKPCILYWVDKLI